MSTKQLCSYVDIKLLNDKFDTTNCKTDINFDNVEKYMEIKKDILYWTNVYRQHR